MKVLAYLGKLLRYAAIRYPILAVCFFLFGVSSAVELAALSFLAPLAAVAMEQPLPDEAAAVGTLRWCGLAPAVHTLLLAFVGLFTLRILLHLLTRGLTSYIGKRIVARLSVLVLKAFYHTWTLSDLERRSIGHFLTLVGDEAHRAAAVLVLLTELGSHLFLAALYFAVICRYSPPAGAAVLGHLLVTCVVTLLGFRLTRHFGSRVLGETRRMQSAFLESINGYRSIKALAAEDYVVGNCRTLVARVARTETWVDVLNALIKMGPMLLLVLMFGAYLLLAAPGRTGEPDLVLVLTLMVCILRLLPVISHCVYAGLQVLTHARAGEDVTEVIRTAMAAAPPRGLVPSAPVRRIEIQNVSFGFHGGAMVIQRANIDLRAGRSYALVGPSGSGKSTLADLLLNFHNIAEGQVLIDGIPHHKFDPRSLRERILLLGQQTTVFNDTVLSNLMFGRLYARAEVEAAAKLACIHDFITTLPAGYDTLLTYRGHNLSGGQRQRLGLARALLRRSDVLILDESTSALDASVRQTVVENIRREYGGRILVFITHDPAVAAVVDEVIRLPAPGGLLAPPDTQARPAAVPA